MSSLVLFAGFDANENNGLWVTDGTASGTHDTCGPRFNCATDPAGFPDSAAAIRAPIA